MIDGTERRRWEWVASRTDFNGGAVRGIVDVRYLSTQPWGTISSAIQRQRERLWRKRLNRILYCITTPRD